MTDEDDVDLARIGAHGAHGIRAERVAEFGRQLAPCAVPVVDLGECGEPDLGQREDDLHALVEPGRAELVEVVAREGHAREVRREAFDPGHLHSEAAVGGTLARRGFDE